MRSPVLTEEVLVNGDVINRRRPRSNRIVSFFPDFSNATGVSIFSFFLFFLLLLLFLFFLFSILEITNAVGTEEEINLG